MTKNISPRQWAHYVCSAKKRGYSSILQAYEKPSKKQIDLWWELTANCDCDYARIVPIDSLDFLVFRRVHDATGTMYVVNVCGECCSISKDGLLRLLESEHEPGLMLYILDIEAAC